MLIDKLLRPTALTNDSSRPAPLQIALQSYSKAILQAAIADMADLTGKSKTAVAEEALVRHVIGADGNEGALIEGVYADLCDETGRPYPESRGIKRAIETHFKHCETYAHNNARADAQGLPVVRLFANLCREKKLKFHEHIQYNDPRYNLEEYYMPSFFKVLKADEKAYDPHGILNTDISSNDRPIQAAPYVEIVADNWNLLREVEKVVIWRYLIYLVASLCAWEDSAVDRGRFRDVMIEVNASRKALDEQDRQAELRREREKLPVRYQLAEDAYVKAPLGWVPINSGESPACKYAGVIVTRDFPDKPNLLFFTNTPVNELSDAEEDKLFAAADKIAPGESLFKANKARREEGADVRVLYYGIPDAIDDPLQSAPPLAQVFRKAQQAE